MGNSQFSMNMDIFCINQEERCVDDMLKMYFGTFYWFMDREDLNSSNLDKFGGQVVILVRREQEANTGGGSLNFESS